MTIRGGSARWWRRWSGFGLLAATIGVFGQTCSPAPDLVGSGQGANSDDAIEVRMRGVAFVPKEVTIKQGQTVRWTNDDLVLHTATSGSPGDPDAGSIFDSPLLALGQSFTHQFNEVGTYVYFCRPHPTTREMVGATVIVEP